MTAQVSKQQFAGMMVLSAVLLVPLFPIPRPMSLAGHPWKVELACFLAFAVIFSILLLKQWKPELPADIRLPRFFLVLFLTWSSLSVFWADGYWSVFHHTAVWAGYLFVFVLSASLLNSKKGLKLIFAAVSFFGILLSVLMLLGYLQVIISPTYENIFRITYSKYSESLLLLFPLFYAAAVCAKNRSGLLLSIASVIAFAAIVVSLSRTSFISAAAAIVVVFFLTVVFFRRKREILRAFGLLAVFGFVFAAAQFAPTSGERETTLYGRFSSTKHYQTSSNDIRRLLVGVSTEMIRDNPVLGIGADNFGTQINKYRSIYGVRNPADESLSAGEELLLERAHNEYLQIFSELGIVGVLIFGALLLSGAFLTIRRLREARNNIELAIRIGAAAGICAFLTSSLASSFSFRAVQNGVLFFILFALAVVPFYRNSEKKVVERNKTSILPALLFSVFAAAAFSLQAVAGYYAIKAEGTKDINASISLYKTASFYDGTDASYDMSVAGKYFGNKKPGIAAVHYANAIDKGAGVIGAYAFLAISHQLADNNPEAEKSMKNCVSVYPRSVFAHIYLASLLKENGKNVESKSYEDAANKLDPAAAATWRRIISNGTVETEIETRNNSNLISLPDLTPQSAVLAFIARDKIYRQTSNH